MKKTIGMFAALMVALAVTGFAFAHWSEILTISGTVNTGILDVELAAGRSWDTENEWKNYSSISCWVDQENSNKLIVEVTNAYPCIDYYQEFTITNTGTIPVHLYVTWIDSPDPEINVDVTGIDCVQLHPDLETNTVTGTIHVHVKQDAEENHTYTFGLEILAIQWNMQPNGE